MNKPVKLLLALLTFVTAGLFAQGQPAPKILVVDMIKLLDEHYKTQEQKDKLSADADKAKEEAGRLLQERNDLVEQYKELVEQTQNPATRVEVKEEAQANAEQKIQEIQRKNNELQSFEANTRNLLQQRFQNFKTIMLEEIAKLATEVAKRKGATLLLDKSGPNLLGISSVVYSDDAMDITNEVQAEINKTRPVSGAKPAAATAAPAADSPRITVPMGK
ncbi:MAG: OmpH family outer membrane protein [Opitutaceae bacterium]|nr:OmpH family outer membrane protein [Opitutaceae bacterium]